MTRRGAGADLAPAGERMRALREGLGLSQAALGELIGISPNTIARWERGEWAYPLVAQLALRYLATMRRQKRRATPASTSDCPGRQT